MRSCSVVQGVVFGCRHADGIARAGEKSTRASRPLPGRGTILPLLLVVSTLPAAGCDTCDQSGAGDRFARARCRIEQLMRREKIASYQVAVAGDGTILYEEAFGMANVADGIPTTTETMHLVASIEKPFVSTAIMILAEQGQLDLHAPVNDYLRGAKLIAYQGDAADATLARLLLHTTGLPYGYYMAGKDVPPEEKRTSSDLIDLAGVLVAAPGTRYQYTNIGYALLDDIVRQTTGEDIQEFITKEVIEPLGLEHTRFFTSEPPRERIATQNVEGDVLPIAYDAAGYTALYSKAGDLARFGMFHLRTHLPDQTKILSDSAIAMMWQYRDPGVEFTTRRLGWDVQRDYGLETIQHGGGGPGIHTWLYMIPSQHIVVAIMSNARYPSTASDPVLVALVEAALGASDGHEFRPRVGRGWSRWPKLDPGGFRGDWTGRIAGPKGERAVAVSFDDGGAPRLRIAGDGRGAGRWVAPSGEVLTNNGAVLWRFDACIPYLYPHALHDEVILTLWPQGERLCGHAAAAREKDFGIGEAYVLPQYVELARSPAD